MFLIFLSFSPLQCPKTYVLWQKWLGLFFTCIKLVVRVLACARAITHIKWSLNQMNNQMKKYEKTDEKQINNQKKNTWKTRHYSYTWFRKWRICCTETKLTRTQIKNTKSRSVKRLLICLARLKVRNSSEKLKNEIRPLLYSLYRSKKLTKTINKNLINTI